MVKCDCGADNPINSKFCQECGTSLVKESENVSDKINDTIIDAAPEENTSEVLGVKNGVNENSRKKSDIDEKEKWTKRLAIYLGIWGVLNLFFAWLFGGILIFFAVLIFASKSFKAIYAFGIVYLLLALIQLFLGIYYVDNYFGTILTQGYALIGLSFINFAVGGYVIYKTKKLDTPL